MAKIFDMDGRIYKVIDFIWKLIQVNLLFILTSIPIVTIGPSLIATYHVLKLIKDKKDGNLWKNYFEIFSGRFSKGSLLLLINVSVITVEGLALITFPKITEFIWLMLIAFTLLIFNTSYILDPIFTTDRESIFKTISFSIGVVMKYTGMSVLGFSVVLLTLFIPIFLPKLIFIWLFLGFSTVMYLSSSIYNSIFKNFE